MNVLILVSLFFVFVDSQYQLNDKCKTPTSKEGICIPLGKCEVLPPIIEAARSGNRTAFKLARDYQCGYNSEILVCCDLKEEVFKPIPRIPIINPPGRQSIVLSAFDSTDLPDRSVCGLSPPEGDRIYNGEETSIGEFPWVAAIEFVRKKDSTYAGIQCGGSLINNRYVVTAAHCILDLHLKIHNVRLGEWNIQTDPDCYEDLPIPECVDKVQIYGVEKEIPHEHYSKKQFSNDIGLLKLNRSVQFTPFIRPICLPPPEMPLVALYTYMTVAGWGITENGTASNVTLKADVPLLSNKVCREMMPKFPISRHQYCAGGETKDSCRGDSGGPLMRTFRNQPDGEDQWFLEGIVGSGLGCGQIGFPAIYLRVTHYTGWIVENLAEERAEPRNARLIAHQFLNARSNDQSEHFDDQIIFND